ncbi:MAG TPA: nicotinamide-nucleotide amidase [Gammaproteobacteria bacterium]|nr:nicotinamide-nucleotide amidase [Gammaproteobacteria bacterium]
MNSIPDDSELDRLAMAVGDRLHSLHRRLATAESCTGGWIAKILTDIPGSSSWFDRGFVTYSNEAKQDMLGVSADILTQHGAVSEACVTAMAEGALDNSRADYTLAVSGIAGPGGATVDKPLGLVWLAWAGGSETAAEQRIFSGDREAVRRQAVRLALEGQLERLI